MQLGEFDAVKGYFAVRALDFIAGYPATEGMLTLNPQEVVGDRKGNGRWLGHIRCIGYTMAHAISIPISPLIALVRVVTTPIFFGLLIKASKPEARSTVFTCLFVGWIRECAGIVTSPLWNVAGVVRAALGIIAPSFYLKAPYVSELSESQGKLAAIFLCQEPVPGIRRYTPARIRF